MTTRKRNTARSSQGAARKTSRKSTRRNSDPIVSRSNSTSVDHSTLVISESIILTSSSREYTARISVGTPVLIGEDCWMCSVSLEGVFQREVTGSTPLNALVLALQHLGMMLFVFVSKGGSFRHHDFALPGSLFLGRLWCSPEDLLELVKQSRERNSS